MKGLVWNSLERAQTRKHGDNSQVGLENLQRRTFMPWLLFASYMSSRYLRHVGKTLDAESEALNLQVNGPHNELMPSVL